MYRNAPQLLNVKRKRNEEPVHTLVVERTKKRARQDGSETPEHVEDTPSKSKPVGEGSVVYRRIVKAHHPSRQLKTASPSNTPQRTFRVSGNFGPVVLIEDTPTKEQNEKPEVVVEDIEGEAMELDTAKAPRKRPGARAAVLRPPAPAADRSASPQPSQDIVRELEEFANEVEKEAAAPQYKPKAPKMRFKERHPEAAAKLAAENENYKRTKEAQEQADLMDTDDYVYDTYVRDTTVTETDVVMTDLTDSSSIGVILLSEEDEAFWFDDSDSDREFDTDEDDENAEGYHGNDYPEDELSSDDEFGRNEYQYFHGASDDEYDLGNASDSDAFSGDDEEGPARRLRNFLADPKPKPQATT
ncbi:hypothetical protein EJ04DRAFT_551671 [Polyplosphaeria fusca]|uniref:Transcription factor Iwr1 domain-containing protein n=1 Tax=Polyplosphaeria fusca TaxID=682080 RepID=A0A9P4R3X3_9PLEO|nr:hypothetical protein EJ04DRAFT_551671 [Polyplosphaeria fusca]